MKKEEKFTQAHILASEVFANTATLIGRSLQAAQYLLWHPDESEKIQEVVIFPTSRPDGPVADPVKNEPAKPASTSPVKPSKF